MAGSGTPLIEEVGVFLDSLATLFLGCRPAPI